MSKATALHHRAALRKRIGLDGDRLWQVMMDLAEGKPFVPVLPDGSFGEPIVPSPDVRLRAAEALADRAFGKAVAATELVKAEAESTELHSIQALSDAELEAELKRLDKFNGKQLNAGPETDAEIINEE